MTNRPPSTQWQLPVLRARDPHEKGQPASPLELFYDLAIVVAFSIASDEFARLLSGGSWGPAVFAFVVVMSGIIWAWISYTWFTSSYHCDDWFSRLLVFVQMTGVLLLCVGIRRFFEGVDQGWQLRIGVLVLGYVVMRVPMIFQWLRVTHDDPARKEAARHVIRIMIGSQVGWLVLAVVQPAPGVAAVWMTILVGTEVYAAIRNNNAHPVSWHPGHIAERFGLLAIIALGEVISGTFSALEVLESESSWALDAIVIVFGGVGLTFGMWWVYFLAPKESLLETRPGRVSRFVLGHLPVFMSITATGAGMRVAALFIRGDADISEIAAVATVVVPVALYLGLIHSGWRFLFAAPIGTRSLFTVAMLTGLVLVSALAMAGLGIDVEWCFCIAALAPWVTVVAYELEGSGLLRRGVRSLAQRR